MGCCAPAPTPGVRRCCYSGWGESQQAGRGAGAQLPQPWAPFLRLPVFPKPRLAVSLPGLQDAPEAGAQSWMWL